MNNLQQKQYEFLVEQERTLNAFKLSILKYSLLITSILMIITSLLLYMYTKNHFCTVQFVVCCFSLFFIQYRTSYLSTWLFSFKDSFQKTFGTLKVKFINVEYLIKEIKDAEKQTTVD